MEMKTMTLNTCLRTALAVLALAGCGCAAPASVATLHTGPGAAKRQLLAVEAAPAVLHSWSLSFTHANYVEKYHWETSKRYDSTGRLKRSRDYKVWEEPFWDASYSHEGDVDGELTYLGSSRFAYKVPAGRFLKITRARGEVGVSGTSVNGMQQTSGWVAGESFELLYGPGQLVSFAFNKNTSVFGYTADVAMLGLGPTPTGGGLPNAAK